jgi:Ca2+-binding RTX toxin-like protein
LSGGGGNDTLNGGTAGDTLAGGFGNDTYLLADTYRDGPIAIITSYDRVVEGAGQGIDLAIAYRTTAFLGRPPSAYTLAENVENGQVGAGALTAFGLNGNASSNRLTGDEAVNTLRGLDGRDTLDGLGGDDILDGGTGADRLFGGLGNDSLTGGEGLDSIRGGLGSDTLIGGDGNDRFEYLATNDSGVTPQTRDVITDFLQLADRIDLSGIDAVEGGGDDAFTFIGTAAFTAPGQVRAFQNGANAIVALNTSGPNTAESQITLSNVTAADLTALDFIL